MTNTHCGCGCALGYFCAAADDASGVLGPSFSLALSLANGCGYACRTVLGPGGAVPV